MGRPLVDFCPSTGCPWALVLGATLACLLLWGCGSSSFVGRQFNNFTAYYNTFHNANQAFEDGREAIRTADRSVDRRRFLPVFRTPDGQSGGSSFEKAVQKSADVLREHPQSKWVDDALLLIGKSYFYQENYVGAAQKFREVLSLDSEREAEARFWLARTLTTSGRLAEAAEALRPGDPDESPENPWTARMSLVRGEILVREEQWEEAEAALERGLRGDLPDEAAGRGAFLLGQVRETLGSPEAAREAYRQVQRHDPPYELGFAARLSEIELQGQHGDAERALGRLRELKDDDKNLENRGSISLVQARVYRALGRPDEARALLRDVLYVPQGGPSLSSSAQGLLHYDLARLYRDVYEDFGRAAAHFDTASTSLSGGVPERSDRRQLPSAPRNLEAQAAQYQNLARQAREVARMDSLLRLGRMSDNQFQAYVDSLRRRQTRDRAQEIEAERAGRRRFQEQVPSRPQDREPSASAAETRSSDAGFLFYKDPTRVQEGRQQFGQTWGDRPLVDNWRRRIAMRRAEETDEEAPVAAEARPDGAEGGRPPNGGAAQSSRPGRDEAVIDVTEVPRDSAAQVEMADERAVARYELANALFLVAGQPDSAATWYRRILQESGDRPIARRALYALAETYRAQGDTTAAQQTFERLVNQYSSTPLAQRARRQLGRQLGTSVAESDRSAPADSAYARAYNQWQEGAWRPALHGLLDVARTYPETRAAPRALLAVGILYWQRTQDDSLRAPRGPVLRYLSSVQTRDSTVLDSTMGGEEPRPNGRFSPADSVWALMSPGDSLRDAASTRSDPAARTSVSGFGTGAAAGALLNRLEWPAPPDSARGDSASVPDSVLYRPLTALLTHLTDRYPEAPQGERARSMLDLIEGRTSSADSTARDSTDSPQAPDSTALAAADAEADSPRRDAREGDLSDSVRTASNRDPLPAPGGEPPSRERQAAGRAGWTLLVASFASSTEASSRAEALRRQLGDAWTVRVFRDPEAEASPHLIVIGQFGSQGAARQVQSALEEKLSRRLEVRRMPTGGP